MRRGQSTSKEDRHTCLTVISSLVHGTGVRAVAQIWLELWETQGGSRLGGGRGFPFPPREGSGVPRKNEFSLEMACFGAF